METGIYEVFERLFSAGRIKFAKVSSDLIILIKERTHFYAKSIGSKIPKNQRSHKCFISALTPSTSVHWRFGTRV